MKSQRFRLYFLTKYEGFSTESAEKKTREPEFFELFPQLKNPFDEFQMNKYLTDFNTWAEENYDDVQ